mgnify:CR=1 FL=1
MRYVYCNSFAMSEEKKILHYIVYMWLLLVRETGVSPL